MTGGLVGLPSGNVTFVFTDIEGSTRIIKRLPDLYASIFERHNELLREAWSTCGGHELRTEGDGSFVAFQSSAEAVVACAEAQRLIGAEPWPDAGVVRVRMGIHTGLAFPRNGDYLALAVNRAKRVTDAAHGGQVLISEESAAVDLPADLSLVPVGRFRVRDFEEPIRLFRLRSPHLDDSISAVRAMPAEGHNLVRQPTSFLGRDVEVASMAALAPGRVVTLAGPGGVGKTRIAVEVGIRVAPSWANGVWFVDLAEVEDPVLVANAIADAVGVHGPGMTADRWTDVLEHLRSSSALVVLDNAESHLDTCAALATELVAVCPGVGVLATSRRPLGVSGEVVIRVSPLPSPIAVQLFVDRAKAVRADFTLTDDPSGDISRTVADICERLDGLPLALEIAAARVAVLDVQEILAGLDDRLRLLRSRDRSLPERQRSMTALLDWSYRLLDGDEQAALRRLSVFGGGFSLEDAAAAVADGDLDADDVPELVWSLVDQSLLVADLAANGTRYRFLETVQHYARRLLDAEDATETVAMRLASWFLDRLGPWHTLDRTWIGDTGLELTNMRGLIPLVASVEPEVAQQLAYAIGRYHYATQNPRGGIDELGLYVDELTTPSPTRVAMLTSLGDLELRTANIKAAEQAVEEADQLRATVGVPTWNDVCVERTSGEIALRIDDLDRAIQIAEAALDRDLSTRGRARMCNLLALALASAGDLEAAQEVFEEELELLVGVGQEGEISIAHGNIAEAAMRLGQPARAALHQRASLDLALALGQRASVAYSFMVAARLAGICGEWQEAVELNAHAGAMLEQSDHRLYESDQQIIDELLAEAKGHLGEAEFARALAEGPRLTTVDAVAMAERVFGAIPERAAGTPRPVV